MKTLVSIKPLLTDDVAMLVKISRETFYDTFAASNNAHDMQQFLDASFNMETLQQEIADTKNNFYGAFANNALAGYCKLRIHTPPKGITLLPAIEIERLYVVENQQGNKIGAVLMQHCVDTAILKGFKSIWLGVWEHNKKAISFYERWGYQIFGSHIFMVGSDAQTDLYMQKGL